MSGKLLTLPQGMESVWGLATDHHSNFLLVDGRPSTVHVLDISGNPIQAIPIPGDRDPRDCTVVGRQLWVSFHNGDIIVMS